MNVLAIIILVIYVICLTFILCYSFVQLSLVFSYLSKKKPNPEEKKITVYPFVTVQLPIYNEKYVVERILETVIEFDYPNDKFEIQVLDDSTDETSEIIASKIKELKKKTKVEIHHIQREDRKGYKAGALADATPKAKGEFIAIFDADFVPSKEFLKKTIPFFEDEKVGVVQTKWEHLNESYSMLTKLQAFGLNAHFTVEQGGRNNGGHFINFNGTAGVWRKTCIADAGGWEADTLTEDLDLSYRAQLKGWKFQYLEKVGSPAELPAAMNALRTQQFRWTKGAAECMRKNLSKVLKDKRVKLSTKFHAVFHLMNSSIFLCIVVLALLSIPLFFLQLNNNSISSLFKYGAIFILSMVFLIIFYWFSLNLKTKNFFKSFFQFVFKFPLFLCFSMGLSLHNAIAVFEGLVGKKTPFVRTPKFNITEKTDRWTSNKYLLKKLSWLTYIEGLLFIYFLFGVICAFYFEDYRMVMFHTMLTIGFGAVFGYTIRHTFMRS